MKQTNIELHKAGRSYGGISKRLDISSSAVQSVIKKFVQFGTAETLPGRSRKQKLSTRTARKLFRDVNNNPQVVLDNNVKRIGD